MRIAIRTLSTKQPVHPPLRRLMSGRQRNAASWAAALAGLAWFAPAAGQPRPRVQLEFPAACEIGKSCEVQYYFDHDPGPGAKDYMCRGLTFDGLTTLNIRLPDMAAQRRGVDVLAAAAGHVVATRDGMPDISVRETRLEHLKGHECGNGVVIEHLDHWRTQYCHLELGSLRVHAGDDVAAGTPLGRIGLSGDTEYPHLGLVVFHNGVKVDPFAPEPHAGCTASAPLWSTTAMAQLAYKRGAVIVTGFTGERPGPESIKDGRVPLFAPDSPYAVAYVEAINLEKDDEQRLSIFDPSGREIAAKFYRVDVRKAETRFYIGAVRKGERWAPGRYRATWSLWRDGVAVLRQDFETTL